MCFPAAPDSNVAIKPMTSGSSVAIQTEITSKDLMIHDKTAVTDASILDID